MGTFNVTTWDDIRNHAASYDPTLTLNLQNDIDLNNQYPYGVSTVTIKLNIGVYTDPGTWTLDGDNGQGGRYKIRNLRTTIANPQSIFNVSNSNNPNMKIVFKNIDFVNLILAGADFLITGDFTGSIEFINCRFVGCRTGHAWLTDKSRKITCTSCYFDMPMYAANSTEYSYCSLIKPLTNDEIAGNGLNLPQAYYCWFHETYGGHVIDDNCAAQIENNPCMTQCQAFCMHGCYIDGSIYMNFYRSSHSAYTFCTLYTTRLMDAYNASTPNVLDMTWSIPETILEVAYVRVLKWNGIWRKGVSQGSSQQYSPQSIGTPQLPNPILATKTQMEDPTWLQSQGFPIIIPTT